MTEGSEQRLVEQRTRELQAANARLEAEIEEREKISQALREQTDILNTMIDGTAEGVVVADCAGRFIIWNKAATRLVGLGPVDIPQEEWTTRYHLIDPFFTTKDDGLGLGLSIAHSITQAHGGRLTAINRPDGGCRFDLVLPLRSG